VDAQAVLYLEPDGIQELSHELGDKETDEFILDLGMTIKQSMQNQDVAGRISDHGFAIILNRDSKDSLSHAADKLMKAYSNHIVELENRSFSATCSIGLVNLGHLDLKPEEILSQARQAHKEAAADGETVVVYRPQLTAITTGEDDRSWLDRIRFAINNQDFYSVQQSIVDLDGQGEHLVENLTFMREDDQNHPPEEYAAIAERTDLGGVIDRHVIPGLLQTFANSDEQQVISLSNNSIMDFGFPAWFADQMKLNAVSGDKIILQIELSAAQTNLKPAQILMRELESLGVRLAVSSFNADRRSLQLLEHLQISYVKLDSEITANLMTSNANQEMVRAIVDAADEQNISVIADEINDTSSLALLWQCGVKLIAGAFLKEDSQVVAG
jgi:diguanylate cyclase (GGDEF)-like protein